MNPVMAGVKVLAQMLPAAEHVDATNPFVLAERLGAQMVEQSFDLWRDLRDTSYETAFLALWTNPAAIAFGAPNAAKRAVKSHDQLRGLPAVTEALAAIDHGGLAEMTPDTRKMLDTLRQAVHLPAATSDVLTNPLASKATPDKSDAA